MTSSSGNSCIFRDLGRCVGEEYLGVICNGHTEMAFNVNRRNVSLDYGAHKKLIQVLGKSEQVVDPEMICPFPWTLNSDGKVCHSDLSRFNGYFLSKLGLDNRMMNQSQKIRAMTFMNAFLSFITDGDPSKIRWNCVPELMMGGLGNGGGGGYLMQCNSFLKMRLSGFTKRNSNKSVLALGSDGATCYLIPVKMFPLSAQIILSLFQISSIRQGKTQTTGSQAPAAGGQATSTPTPTTVPIFNTSTASSFTPGANDLLEAPFNCFINLARNTIDGTRPIVLWGSNNSGNDCTIDPLILGGLESVSNLGGYSPFGVTNLLSNFSLVQDPSCVNTL